jgi:hypothetical protein
MAACGNYNREFEQNLQAFDDQNLLLMLTIVSKHSAVPLWSVSGWELAYVTAPDQQHDGFSYAERDSDALSRRLLLGAFSTDTHFSWAMTYSSRSVTCCSWSGGNRKRVQRDCKAGMILLT